MKKFRVVQWGMGAMGSGMVKMMLEKKSVEVVAAIDYDPKKKGEDIGDICKIGRKTGVTCTDNPDSVLNKDNVDIVLMATASFVHEVYDDIIKVVEKGINVISIAEEMAYPQAANPELAKKMDEAAKKHGVTVFGTGINPGFVLDALIVMMTSSCINIEKVEASRINDLSPFGPTVMRTQGVGTTVEEFEKGIADGSIVGHIGFQQSISLIAKALGWELDEIKETRKPIISNVHRETEHVVVKPGMVAGCHHIGYGMKDGKSIITLNHPQQIHPNMEGVDTGDYINIFGTPNINLAIKPEIPGGIGTMAATVNAIPQVVETGAGLKNVLDIRQPSAII